jgi:hypothetical protein
MYVSICPGGIKKEKPRFSSLDLSEAREIAATATANMNGFRVDSFVHHPAPIHISPPRASSSSSSTTTTTTTTT